MSIGVSRITLNTLLYLFLHRYVLRYALRELSHLLQTSLPALKASPVGKS